MSSSQIQMIEISAFSNIYTKLERPDSPLVGGEKKLIHIFPQEYLWENECHDHGRNLISLSRAQKY